MTAGAFAGQAAERNVRILTIRKLDERDAYSDSYPEIVPFSCSSRESILIPYGPRWPLVKREWQGWSARHSIGMRMMA